MQSGGAWLASTDCLRSLILDTFEQVSLCTEATSDLAIQAIKNLFGLTRLLLLPAWEEAAETEDDNNKQLGLRFVIKRAVKLANQELVTSPRTIVQRTLMFNYLAAVCLSPEAADRLAADSDILRLILKPLQREISNAGGSAELAAHCTEVVGLLKARLPDQLFSRVSMEVQLGLSRVRGERRAQKRQAVIRHPAVAAKRKIQQNEAKKRRAKKARHKQ
jgi:hypothetical protein